MARKTRKFGTGGSADRNKSRYDRKTADIDSDYQKALRKGKDKEVAKAKYEQRMADAKDDLAKWSGSDRSGTRAAERAAEDNLSSARRVSRAAPGTSRTSAVSSIMSKEDPKVNTDLSKLAPVGGPALPSKTPAKKASAPVRRPAAPAKTSAPVRRPAAPTKTVTKSNAPIPEGKGPPITVVANKKAYKPSPEMQRILNAPIDMPGRINRSPTAAQQRKLADNKVRGDAEWAKAQETVKRNATMTEREKVAAKMRSYGVPGYAKGGSVDGIAKRGKTRAPMRRK